MKAEPRSTRAKTELCGGLSGSNVGYYRKRGRLQKKKRRVAAVSANRWQHRHLSKDRWIAPMTAQRPITPLRLDPSAVNRDAVASVVRAAIATGLAKFDRDTTPAAVARRMWGGDRGVDLVLRAAVTPTALSNAGPLAQIAVAYLETLVPVSAGADLLARGIGLNFSGQASISVPAVQVPAADFVGEGQPIPVVTAPTTPGPTLTASKIAVIMTLTHEIMTNPNAETLVQQALVESTGPALDKVMFSSAAAVANERPAGLLHNITALNASNGTDKLDNLVDDLAALATSVAPVAGNGDIVLIAAPAQAVALKLRPISPITWPVLTSASLAAGTVIAVAANAVVSAVEGAPQIDASGHTELHRFTTPAEIVNVGGVSAVPVGSIFQTDEIALRLRWLISFALRTPAGIAWISGCNW
jgi:hypothetical protein